MIETNGWPLARLRPLLVVALIAAGLIPGLSGELHAQTDLFFDQFGASPRATGMGQAYCALAEGASAAYYNPAGLTQLDSGFSLSLGYVWAKPKMWARYRDEPELDFKEDLPSSGPLIGVAADFSKISVFRDHNSFMTRFAFGLVTYLNMPEVNQFWNPQYRQDPYPLKYNQRYVLVSFAISVAARVTDWISVGVGMMPRTDSFQDTSDMPVAVNEAFNPASTDPAKGFRLNLRQKTVISAIPVVGLLVRPPIRGLKERIRLGLAYRGELGGFYGTGPTRIDVVWEKPDGTYIIIWPTPEGRTVDFVGYNPRQLVWGIAADLWEGLTVAVEGVWKDYSDFRFFWHLKPDYLGDTPLFSDVWFARIGGEYSWGPQWHAPVLRKISRMSVRAGYYWEPSPVPDMSGPMNILDTDKDVLSAGFGFWYKAKGFELVKFDFFGQYHILGARLIWNEPSAVFPEDPDPLYGPIRLGGYVFSLGMTVSMCF